VAENSKIEWTDHTFNPWVGCTKVSPACDHCYAEGWAKRTGQAGLWNGERRRTSTANWRLPYKWNNAAPLSGPRPRVFCASLADVFDNQAAPEWRRDLWWLIRETPNLDWLLLTKRPQNIVKMLPDNWGEGYPNVWLGTTVENQTEAGRRIVALLEVPAVIHFLFEERWAQQLKRQCEDALVPFFMKQMSGVRKPLPPIPQHLMLRQFPAEALAA
jgi:protein gp37